MRHSKKFLGSERVATYLHTQWCEECNTSMKQDKVSNDPSSFSCHMFTYALVCTRKKVNDIDDQNRLFGLVTHQDCSLTNTETCIGLGRICNIIVCPLHSDSMLCQHIFYVNSSHCWLLLLLRILFPCTCLSLTDLPNFTTFHNVELSTNRDPISWINSRRKHHTKFHRWGHRGRSRSSVPVSVCEQMRPPGTRVSWSRAIVRPPRTGVFRSRAIVRPPRTGVFGRRGVTAPDCTGFGDRFPLLKKIW
jgi:hypothetical protein